MKIDILAFGAHPDDVELSCAGTLLVEKSKGKTIGVIDLTEGELGTRGTVETRYQEAKDAAVILGLSVRENLQLPDGFFTNDRASQLKIIQAIRTYCPEIILCNAPEDRHPDHGKGAQLVADAAFLSGLQKIETIVDGQPQKAWRPKYVLHYIQDRFLQPDFLVDVSPVFDNKLASIKAYTTQFHQPGMEGPQTYISTPGFLEGVIHRHQMLGRMIGVKFAEGFISSKKIGIRSLDALVQENT